MASFTSFFRGKTKKLEKQDEKQQGLAPSKTNTKIILLGAGYCGKTTLFEQFIANHDHVDKPELYTYKRIIFENIYKCMTWVTSKCEELGIGSNSALAEFRSIDYDPYDDRERQFSEKEVKTMLELFRTPGIDTIWPKPPEFDSVAFFLGERLAEISMEDWVPTTQDVLRATIRTSGITQRSIETNKAVHSVYDTGGQRNERRKWIHIFEDVSLVVFVADLSGYTEVLFEDSSMNKLSEDINLFHNITESVHFQHVPIVLVLNKVDMFEKKLREVGLDETDWEANVFGADEGEGTGGHDSPQPPLPPPIIKEVDETGNQQGDIPDPLEKGGEDGKSPSSKPGGDTPPVCPGGKCTCGGGYPFPSACTCGVQAAAKEYVRSKFVQGRRPVSVVMSCAVDASNVEQYMKPMLDLAVERKLMQEGLTPQAPCSTFKMEPPLTLPKYARGAALPGAATPPPDEYPDALQKEVAGEDEEDNCDPPLDVDPPFSPEDPHVKQALESQDPE